MREVPSHQTRPVWTEISSSALMSNFRSVRSAAQMDVLAVVKADAYGHGSRECSPILVQAGARWLGVTSVEEGVAVRQAVGKLPQSMAPRILVMCGVWLREARTCITHQLTPVVWEPYQLTMLEEEARAQRLIARDLAVHLEIDTGMSRQGVVPGAALEALLTRFTPDSPLRLEGVMTHLASAEDTAGPQNAAQIAVFHEGVKQCAKHKPEILHIGNTPAVDGDVVQGWLPQLARSIGATAMTRTGLALYGYTIPLTAGQHHVHTRPPLTWKTRIVSLRDVVAGTSVGYSATFIAPHAMKLALLPVGYADGYRRELSSRGYVLLRGQKAPIVGRVSMDLTVIDVSAIKTPQVGEEVVLLGSQGSERIGVDELAETAQTIPYEILCGISDRVPRLVVE